MDKNEGGGVGIMERDYVSKGQDILLFHLSKCISLVSMPTCGLLSVYNFKLQA